MTLTPNSSQTSYLPATEMLKRFDARLIADLVSDNGIRVGGPGANPTSVAANANLLAVLLDASGDVEAACLRGNRYQPTDLAALTGAAQARLYRLVGRLAMCYLYERRPDKGAIPETYKVAWDHLDALASGEQIFGFVEAQNAGLMQTEVETPEIVETRFLTTVAARGYYGCRLNQIPPT